MCFSAEAGFTAAAILLTAGAIGIQRAYRTDRRYLPLAALPIFFGFQQLFEGLVWTGNALSSDAMVQRYSLAYMFFSWLAWPVWIPFSAYFLEPCGRRYVYLIFAIMGGMLGASTSPILRMKDGWSQNSFLMRSAIRELCFLISLCVANLRMQYISS
jgi:Family of unknown function (DUF6629)